MPTKQSLKSEPKVASEPKIAPEQKPSPEPKAAVAEQKAAPEQKKAPPEPKPANERIGTSEFVRNERTGEIYIRGYGFSPKGHVAPTARLSDGSLVPPRRTHIRRSDIAANIPDCPDPDCGFEIVIDGGRAVGETIEVVGTIGGEPMTETVPLLVARARTVSAELRLRDLQINTANHRLSLSGDLIGDAAGFTLSRFQHKGLPIPIKASFSPPVAATEAKPAKLSFKLAAPLVVEIDRRPFQAFVNVGDELELVFSLSKSDYKVVSKLRVEQKNLHEAAGAIHAVRYSTTSRRLDVKGAFLGPFAHGTVKLTLDGVPLPGSARLEADAVSVPAALTRTYDCPFSEWHWCDEVEAPPGEKSVLRAELSDGGKLLGVAEMRLTAKTLEQTEEELEPSYFVSALTPVFADFVAKATPTEDPSVLMVFPGDLFGTFGGGPARVIEIARYLTGMGYSVGLVDRVADPSSDAGLPEWAADIFRFRVGLRREQAPEIIRLALDRMNHEVSAENLRSALQEALGPKPDGIDLISRRMDPSFNAFAAYVASLCKPDFVVANFAWAAPTLSLLPSQVCKILDLHDVQYLRGLSHKAMTGEDEFITSLDGERDCWATADYLLAIQNDDKDFVLQASGRNNVILTSHALPIRPPAKAKKPVVLFVGNRYPPNVKGLEDFIQKSWATIRKAVPKAELHVVGSVSKDFPDVPAGVVVRGIVDDIDACYRAAAVVVNPVTFGSGLNIKSVEALCNAKCFVATPFGVKGIPLSEGEARVVELDAMGEAVAQLLQDASGREAYEEAAHAFAQRELSPERIYRELFNTMELRLYV